ARARRALPSATATGAGIDLIAPELVRPDAIPGGYAAKILERVRRAAAAAARAQGLPLVAGREPPRAKANGSGFAARVLEVAEKFDAARYDIKRSTYEIPAYDGSKRQAHVAEKADPLHRIDQLLDQTLALIDM